MDFEGIGILMAGAATILTAVKVPDIIKYLREKNKQDLSNLRSRVKKLYDENNNLKAKIKELEENELITIQTLKILIPIIKSNIGDNKELNQLIEMLEKIKKK